MYVYWYFVPVDYYDVFSIPPASRQQVTDWTTAVRYFSASTYYAYNCLPYFGLFPFKNYSNFKFSCKVIFVRGDPLPYTLTLWIRMRLHFVFVIFVCVMTFENKTMTEITKNTVCNWPVWQYHCREWSGCPPAWSWHDTGSSPATWSSRESPEKKQPPPSMIVKI